MAIDQRGQVTTTGMMNNPATNVQAPDMRNLAPPQQTTNQSTQVAKQPVKVPPQSMDNVPREAGIVESIQRNITAEDMTVLAPVLSPSVKNVLVKIVPDIAPLMEGIGPDEETVPLKVSTFASLPGDIQDFIIESSTEQMDTNNTYIKEKVAANHSQLKTLNGRINKAENNISKITSIGSTFGFIITIIMSYFGFRK